MMTNPDNVHTVTYSTGPAPELALDIYPPTGPNRRIAVLILHGGGWRHGSKDYVAHQALTLAAAGFTAIAVQYRLLDVAPWPAPFDDASAALDWTRANAGQLDVNPDWTVVQGHSAGGHLALMTGTLDPGRRPSAIVAFYPPIGFHRAGPPPAPDPTRPPEIELDTLGRVPGWMLLPPEATDAELDTASPYALIEPGFPSTLLHHGTDDTYVHPRSSLALHQKLLEHGVHSELHTYTGRGHNFDVAPNLTRLTATITESFIARTVIDPAADAADAAQYAFPPRIPA